MYRNERTQCKFFNKSNDFSCAHNPSTRYIIKNYLKTNNMLVYDGRKKEEEKKTAKKKTVNRL